MTQAAAKVQRPGNDVYSSSAALREQREAQAMPKEAQAAAAAEIHGVALGRLREAQQVDSVDGNVDPERLERVTRREVEAGRMAWNSDFRAFALAAATVFGKGGVPPKPRGWLGRLVGRRRGGGPV